MSPITGYTAACPADDFASSVFFALVLERASSELDGVAFCRPHIVYPVEVNRWSRRYRNGGNSQGLRLTKQVLEDAHISVGDDVDVTTRDGTIIIAPIKRIRGKRSLQELVSRIPKNYKVVEIDWGKPVGREGW